MAQIDEGKLFEQEVWSIARELWPSAEGGGPITVDGSEKDGIYITEEMVHIIECTISKGQKKAQNDIESLRQLVDKYKRQYPDKGVKAYFITKHEPTGEQRSVIPSAYTSQILAMSFSRFHSKIIDVSNYFKHRENHFFGSIKNPIDDSDTKAHYDFIPVQLSEINSSKGWATGDIYNNLIHGKRIVILGQYGVGKSVTLKEVFKKSLKAYKGSLTTKFCIYINLREHIGQTNPVEVLERHARNLGFPYPYHLVRAWKSGYADIILDGFDEIPALGWADKTSKLKTIRQNAMQLVREFVKLTPKQSGLLISGRNNFFDSIQECVTALGLTNNYTILTLEDFNEQQANTFLRRFLKDDNIVVPEWFPSKPLLLGYLVKQHIINQDILGNKAISPAQGWDILLDEISEREASIDPSLSAKVIREIIEGVASHARKYQSGLGPIYFKDLESIFSEKVGYLADDNAVVLLQRLPGLGGLNQQDGSREFIDINFADAAKSGEIIRYILNPYEYKISSEPKVWQESINEISIQLLSLKTKSLSPTVMEAAARQAERSGLDVLGADILLTMRYNEQSWIKEPIKIQSIVIPAFHSKNLPGWNLVRFEEVIVKRISFEEEIEVANHPKFVRSLFGFADGIASATSLPNENFLECEFESFEAINQTTASILESSLPIPVKVCFTVLKKLYFQPGVGRQYSAFTRGLSNVEKRYIDDVLRILRQEGLTIAPSNNSDVWVPIRAQSPRVKALVQNRTVNDPLIEKIKRLS
ncbi:NACHT domain-containing protein [Hymenobacter baengnokdamensis]|uniref:NACHT domain-containing protein n=1 Tax=Hymenobacter baengnokdamensis TaxID=2615203 RepID=UPI0012453FFA|nr:NACHT domain-containing protein [Hymenobacter baengnokdamensis]